MTSKQWNGNQRVLVGLGVVAGLAFAIAMRTWLGDASESGWSQSTTQSSATEIVNRHLAWADSQGQGSVTAEVAPIRELFGEARKGTRKFAEEALSLKSKWKLVTDFVTDGNEHKAFLQEQFSEHVFAPEVLEALVQSAVAGHIRHLDDVDSQLLVRLQADLAGVPNLQLSANVDRQSIQTALDASVRQAISAVQAQLGPGAGLELVSYVAGEVLASATLKLAGSAGILGAGAASGTMTFGVGLVVGIIVDYVVSWAFDEIFDPTGELTKQLNQTLDALEQLVLTGDANGPGLIQRLEDYGGRRSQARNAAIRSAVLPDSAAVETAPVF